MKLINYPKIHIKKNIGRVITGTGYSLLRLKNLLIEYKTDLIQKYIIIGEWDIAESMLDKNIKLAKVNNNVKFNAENLTNLGILLINKGKYDNVSVILNNALELYSSINDKVGINRVKKSIGLLYFYTGKLKKSMAICIEVLEVAKKLKHDEQIANTYNTLGVLYKNLGEDYKALECYESSLEISIKMDSTSGIARAYGNIANIYRRMKLPDKALRNYVKAIGMFKQIGDKSELCVIYNNLGNFYADYSKPDKAMRYYCNLNRIAKEIGYKIVESTATMNIGVIYSEKQQYSLAIKFLEESLLVAKSINNIYSIMYILGYLAEVYEQIEDFVKALIYCEEALKLSNDLRNQYDIIYNSVMKIRLMINLIDAKQNIDFDVDNVTNLLDSILDKSILLESDEDVFTLKLLKSRIIAFTNRFDAESYLLALTSEYTEVHYLGDIYLYLFQVTGKEEYRQKSLSIFTSLLEKEKHYTYNKKITILK